MLLIPQKYTLQKIHDLRKKITHPASPPKSTLSAKNPRSQNPTNARSLQKNHDAVWDVSKCVLDSNLCMANSFIYANKALICAMRLSPCRCPINSQTARVNSDVSVY